MSSRDLGDLVQRLGFLVEVFVDRTAVFTVAVDTGDTGSSTERLLDDLTCSTAEDDFDFFEGDLELVC